jgi:hypothetical protein
MEILNDIRIAASIRDTVELIAKTNFITFVFPDQLEGIKCSLAMDSKRNKNVSYYLML